MYMYIFLVVGRVVIHASGETKFGEDKMAAFWSTTEVVTFLKHFALHLGVFCHAVGQTICLCFNSSEQFDFCVDYRPWSVRRKRDFRQRDGRGLDQNREQPSPPEE